MELPNEFQFRTVDSEGPYYAYKFMGGYSVKFGETKAQYSNGSVQELLEKGTWKVITPNINFEDDYIEPIEDVINRPNHYHKGEIDVNGYLEKHFPKQANVSVAEGFYIGNIIKYVSRHKEKGGLQDLEKAEFNLRKLMELRKGN